MEIPPLLQALPGHKRSETGGLAEEVSLPVCYHAFPRHLLLVSSRGRTVGDRDMRGVTRYSSPVPLL